jgi:enterochelin esterase-like enzyme
MKARLRGRIGTWLVAAFASQAGACKSTTHTASWSSEGDTLGQRVREGRVAGVTHLRFVSAVLGREVAAVVATPPDYFDRPEQRYPVVYVFPGIGGDEWTYLRDVTLDNPAVQTLFANAETAPILVFANPADSAGEGHAQAVLGDELVREVDVRFRTRMHAKSRSLEGFSLGGVTALNLYLHRSTVFGQVVALSGACYLLPSCAALRDRLAAKARQIQRPRVMLAIGGAENAQNREVGDQLAPLLGTTLETLDGADHDWRALLQAPARGAPFGRHIAEFHLSGFATVSTQ